VLTAYQVLAAATLNYDGIMSKTRQISITLPEDLIETIRAAVERGEARSVSSYIASRLAPGVIMDALFAEWDAERGAPSEEIGAWAEQELDRAFAEQAMRNRGGSAA
jgi:Arc/MetJ-type ribon-helix-helix transcriptional regulator